MTDDPRKHPYWNESQGRIVIPPLTKDKFIVHSNLSSEHRALLHQLDIAPSQHIFHEDALLYLREKEKNKAFAKNLAWAIDPKLVSGTLDQVGRSNIIFQRERRINTLEIRKKAPAMINRTAKTMGSGFVLGFSSGGLYGGAVGAATGFGAGVLLSGAEAFWTAAERYGFTRPENVGLEYQPPKKRQKSKNVLDAD